MTLSDLARDRNQLAQALTKIKSRALRFAWGLEVGSVSGHFIKSNLADL